MDERHADTPRDAIETQYPHTSLGTDDKPIQKHLHKDTGRETT